MTTRYILVMHLASEVDMSLDMSMEDKDNQQHDKN